MRKRQIKVGMDQAKVNDIIMANKAMIWVDDITATIDALQRKNRAIRANLLKSLDKHRFRVHEYGQDVVLWENIKKELRA